MRAVRICGLIAGQRYCGGFNVFRNRRSVCNQIRMLAHMTGREDLVPSNIYRKPEDTVRDLYRSLHKLARRKGLIKGAK